MKKLKMSRSVTLTFEEGCNKYSENCGRNLSPHISFADNILSKADIF